MALRAHNLICCRTATGLSTAKTRGLLRARCFLSPNQPFCRALTGGPGGGSGWLEPLQGALVAAQHLSDMPWWVVLGASAVAVRACLFPVVYASEKAGERLVEAMPQLAYLHTLTSAKLKRAAGGREVSAADRRRAIMDTLLNFKRGAGAALRLHDASPLRVAAAPLLGIPVFVTAVLTTRSLVDAGGHGLEVGGWGAFLDLTSRDETLILPLAAVAATYLNLELSLGKSGWGSPVDPLPPAPLSSSSSPAKDEPSPDPNPLHPSVPIAGSPDVSRGVSAAKQQPPTFMLYLKGGLQTILLIGLPMVSTLPTGAFVFWLTSSTISAAQITALRSKGFRRFLGLKPKNRPRS